MRSAGMSKASVRNVQMCAAACDTTAGTTTKQYACPLLGSHAAASCLRYQCADMCANTRLVSQHGDQELDCNHATSVDPPPPLILHHPHLCVDLCIVRQHGSQAQLQPYSQCTPPPGEKVPEKKGNARTHARTHTHTHTHTHSNCLLPHTCSSLH
jgi:hypothetical protein